MNDNIDKLEAIYIHEHKGTHQRLEDRSFYALFTWNASMNEDGSQFSNAIIYKCVR